MRHLIFALQCSALVALRIDTTLRIEPSALRVERRKALAAGCAAVSAALGTRAAAAPPRRVLVAGASGRSGREVVKALAAAGYEVVPLVRNASRWRDVAERTSLRVVEADVTDAASLAPALRNVDDVVCDVGFVPTFDADADRRAALAVDRDGVVALVDAAEKARLPGRFVLVSSLLTGAEAARRANLSYRMLNKLGNVVEAKRAAEERLRASALDYVILRPGVFVDNAQGGLVFAGEDRFLGEADDARGLDRVSCKSPFFASSGAACGVTRGQLADACVAALADRDAGRRTVEVVARPGATGIVRLP